MQKILLSLLCIATLMLSLSACSSPSGTPGETAASTDILDADTPVQTGASAEPDGFSETLINNEDCTFIITGIDEDAFMGYTLNVFLENKTDLELMFSLADVSVNGFMCDPFWASSVMPGMKANESVTFSDSAFLQNGITEVTEIVFTLRVYDSNDWMAEHIAEETFTVYPLGEGAAAEYERVPSENDLVLFDNGDVSMRITGFDPDNLFGFTMNVYLENRTDKTLMFSASDVSVNGFMCDPYWAFSVAPGKRAYSSLTWTTASLEDNGIETVESIVLPIRVYDSNNILNSDLLDEIFTVTP